MFWLGIVKAPEDDFPDREQLDRMLERERAKDTTLDYAKAFAARREIHVPVELQEPERRPEKKKGMFDGLKLGRGVAEPGETPASPAHEAPPAAISSQVADGQAVLIDYARAYADAERMRDAGLPVLPHQTRALERTGSALVAAVGQDKAIDVYEAFQDMPSLAEGIEAPDGVVKAVAVATHIGKLRQDPELRADSFVATYTALRDRCLQLNGPDDREARRSVEAELAERLDAIEADPAMEAVLQSRQRALEGGRAAEREIGKAIGRERERERGMDRER